MLTLFSSKGMTTYGGEYTLDGIMLSSLRDYALVAANGPSGDRSRPTSTGRPTSRDVWNMATPTGPARYFSGLLHLTALLILSGQYRVL